MNKRRGLPLSKSLARRIAFARHVPPRQILRRFYLAAKRRVLERFGPRILRAPKDLQPVAAPPLPLFPARRGALARLGSEERAEAGWQGLRQQESGTAVRDTFPQSAQSAIASTNLPSLSAGEAPLARDAGFQFTFLNNTRGLPGKITWRVASAGRRHQLWSMHLHYMEYLEEASGADFTLLVEDWLNANRPYEPRYWHDIWNSYTVSLRTLVWMQQWAARPLLDPALRARMAESIAGQIAFLASNLETDIGGNHLVKNAKALIWASSFFGGRTAQRWRHAGVRLLQRILDDQILPDGLHYERSLSYHAQVFADLLECRHVLGPSAMGARFDTALGAMAQAIADLTHPDGGPPLFNDSGLHMAYAPADCLSAYEQLTGARPKPRANAAYANAGYFCLRTGPDFLMADCGPIAPDALPAHGHGDILSFEWSVGGRRIVVDPGVFEYAAGERRMLCRSCRAHNTVTLDSLDQAEFYGDFRVGRRPRATLRRLETGDGTMLIEGSHDGFARAPGRPVHVRSFDARRGRVSIRDRFGGRPRGTASAGILLHPDVKAEPSGSNVRLSADGLEIELCANRPAVLANAVWWPDLGAEIATKRIEFTFPADGELAVDLHVRARPGPGS
ncbi:MAG: heparinase II/III family protein [Beijerinckiaceae bacterium]|nr:heparinase II/III family protein [Beijerinckiaceae bacterium]